ncbi:hypothetical protein D3C86_1869030 [compost metagenome]
MGKLPIEVRGNHCCRLGYKDLFQCIGTQCERPFIDFGVYGDRPDGMNCGAAVKARVCHCHYAIPGGDAQTPQCDFQSIRAVRHAHAMVASYVLGKFSLE